MSCCFARVGLENSQASEAAQPRGLVVSAVAWSLGKLVLWGRQLALNLELELPSSITPFLQVGSALACGLQANWGY